MQVRAGRLVEHHGIGEVIIAEPGDVAQRKRLIRVLGGPYITANLYCICFNDIDININY